MPLPRAFIYCRVSTKRQFDSGLSIDEQRRQCEDYAAYQKFDVGDRVFVDQARAYQKPFRERPGGEIIFKGLAAGDHLIISKLDRGFRDVEDCLSTVKTLQERGVHVHILDIRVDTTTAIGELILSVMAAIARFESARRSERIHEAKRGGWARGRPQQRYAPIGFKWYGTGRERHLLPCAATREMMKLFWKWRFEEGIPDRDIHIRTWKEKIKRTDGREWTRDAVVKAICIERELREIEVMFPNLSEKEVSKVWLQKQADQAVPIDTIVRREGCASENGRTGTRHVADVG